MHSLDRNTHAWINDRAENNEPLMWGEFIRFMKEIGASQKSLKKYKTKSYKRAVQKKFAETKKMMKQMSRWKYV